MSDQSSPTDSGYTAEIDDFTAQIQVVPNDQELVAELWVSDLSEDGWSGDLETLADRMRLCADSWHRLDIGREELVGRSSLVMGGAIMRTGHANRQRSRQFIRELSSAVVSELDEGRDDFILGELAAGRRFTRSA